MAIALDSTSHSNVTGTSLTFSHTTAGSDRLLVVGIEAGTSDVVTGVTYNSVAMTRVPTNGFQGNANSTAYIYYLLAPSTGANNIVISTSSSVFIQGDAASFTGVGSSQPDASVKNTANAAGSVANTLVTIADNAIHLAVYGVDAFPVTSVTNGTLVPSGNGVLAYSNPLVITPAGSNTMTGNSSGGNNNWATVGASFGPGIQTTTSTSSSTSTSTTTTSTSTSTTTSTSTSTSTSTTTTSTSTSTTTTSTSTTTTSTSTTTTSTSTSTTTTSTSTSTSSSSSTTTTMPFEVYLDTDELNIALDEATY